MPRDNFYLKMGGLYEKIYNGAGPRNYELTLYFI